jgi:hypothetical protein
MNITRGKMANAKKVVIYGVEGIGKTTLAAHFPEPLFIDTEGSTADMDVARFDTPDSWAMLLAEIEAIAVSPGLCKTLVIDTADWAERLAAEYLCTKYEQSGIESFGYGKGYTYLAEEFGRMLDSLTSITKTGVNVVLCAHAIIKKVERPDESGAYDRFELKLQKKTAPLLKEWCDLLLFCDYKTIVISGQDGKAKAAGGERVMRTSHHVCWDAKNRSGLADELPLAYGAIRHVIEGDEAAPTIPTDSEDYAYLEPLYALMAKDNITDGDLRHAVALKGAYAEDAPIKSYDRQYVEGVLIAAWDQVKAAIDADKQKTQE